jgi:hypothetical protein
VDELCQSYEDWKHCITVRCGIPLSAPYLKERIEALANPRDPMTARFVILYGPDHLARTRGWFEQALSELERK